MIYIAWSGTSCFSSHLIMRDALLDDFVGYLEYKAIIASGEISETEQVQITAQRQALLEKLQ